MKSVWILMVALLCASAQAAGNANLSPRDHNWKSGIEGAAGSTATVDMQKCLHISCTGEGSLAICRDIESKDQKIGYWNHVIATEPGHKYRFTAKVLLKKVAGKGVYLEADGKRSQAVVSQGRPVDKWADLSVEFEPAADHNTATVALVMDSSSGKCWFDDIRLEDLGAK